MSNLNKLKAELKRSGPDALMITGDTARLWATGFGSTAGIVLVTGNDAYFLTDSRYYEAAQNAVKDAEVRLIARGSDFYGEINKAIAEHGVKILGFEEDSVAFSSYKRFSEKIEAKLKPAGKIISLLRASKSRAELEKMKEVQRIAEKSYRETLPLITRGMTEKEIASELICRMLRNGADDKSFDPIVVSGPRSSMPHGVPEDRPIDNGFLTMDFGAKKNGWCSDTTRTVCISDPTEEMINVYETVLKAQKAGIEAARAGVTGSEVDGAARRIIEDAGYGQYFGHAFGHGLGVDVHEAPAVSPSSSEPLPEGAVISAEPGVYIPGKFGVRIEDILYLTRDGCENITNLPKNLEILHI